MSITSSTGMALFAFCVAVMCVAIQKFFRGYLESDQYYYLKDITLIAAWALCGVWMSDNSLRIVIAAAVVASCVGFCQKVTKGRNLRFLYFLVALAFAVFGPRVAFVEFSGGEYYYLSSCTSTVISALWVGIFPIFFQEIDEIPGLGGLLLSMSWLLLSLIVLTYPGGIESSGQICIMGAILLSVFFTRHVDPYRRLTEPLTALWGTLFTGLSILAASKGVAFRALLSLSIGLFILPLAEIAFGVVSAVISPKPTGSSILYRRLISGGCGHPLSVIIVVFICAFFACLAVVFHVRAYTAILMLVSAAALLLFAKLNFYYAPAFSNKLNRNSGIWGLRIDNISLNYALSQVQHWVNVEKKPHLIVTPDALAALRSRTDERYKKIVRSAGLVLPDGAGLIAALTLIGSPIRERIPGVEFTEHLCRRAAYEGWRVWFLGGEPGVAKKASEVLVRMYPNLIVAGTMDGYFPKEESLAICSEISKSKAQILFVGMGVPMQEYWLSQYLENTGAVVGMGIGGTMDIISGKLARAPAIWQKLCVEWLYRTIQEPCRWRRILKLPVFMFYVLLTFLRLDGYSAKKCEE